QRAGLLLRPALPGHRPLPAARHARPRRPGALAVHARARPRLLHPAHGRHLTMAPAPIDPDGFADVVARLEGEIRKVIVGQDDVVRSVLICLLTEGHVLLEGVPGLGKTQLLRTLSEAMALQFSRIQCTPDL